MDQPFDDSAKNFYQRFFADLGMKTTAQHEVFSRSRSIDLLVECGVIELPRLQETVFSHFRRVNALEFKGFHDPLTAVDFNLIMMRAWGVGVRDLPQVADELDEGAIEGDQPEEDEADENSPYLKTREIAEAPSQRTVTIVSVTRPQRVLDTLQHEFGFAATDEPGIYRNPYSQLPVWIIHPTELDLKPANYPLLPLARGGKLEQFIDVCVTEGLVDYLRLTLDIGVSIDPDAIWHKIMELVNMKVTVREETWPYIDEFFQKVPEALQNLPTLKEAFEEHARQAAEEAVAEAAKEAAKEVEEAEMRGEIRGEVRGEIRGEARGEIRGEIRGKLQGQTESLQQSLQTVLRHRFGKVPPEITEQIEQTSDLQQLNHWLEEALSAETLAQLEFRLDAPE